MLQRALGSYFLCHSFNQRLFAVWGLALGIRCPPPVRHREARRAGQRVSPSIDPTGERKSQKVFRSLSFKVFTAGVHSHCQQSEAAAALRPNTLDRAEVRLFTFTSMHGHVRVVTAARQQPRSGRRRRLRVVIVVQQQQRLVFVAAQTLIAVTINLRKR